MSDKVLPKRSIEMSAKGKAPIAHPLWHDKSSGMTNEDMEKCLNTAVSSNLVKVGQVWSYLEGNGQTRIFKVRALVLSYRGRTARGIDTKGRRVMCSLEKLEEKRKGVQLLDESAFIPETSFEEEREEDIDIQSSETDQYEIKTLDGVSLKIYDELFDALRAMRTVARGDYVYRVSDGKMMAFGSRVLEMKKREQKKNKKVFLKDLSGQKSE